MKVCRIVGLLAVGICALKVLLGSPEIPLLLGGALVGLLLSLRFPEILAMGMVGIGLMPHAYMIRWGFPSIGLNLLDLAVMMMLVVTVARWRAVRAALSSERLLRALVLFVFAAGFVALLHGYFAGFEIRTSLRSFRFYFHLVVTFHFAALLARSGQQQRLVFAWIVLVLIQLPLVGINVINYSPDDPGTLLLAPDIYWTSTHFLPLKTFYPALIALAILALARGKRSVLLTAAQWALVAVLLIVLAFTYKRSQYVGFASGLLALGLGTLFAEFHRTRHLTPMLFRALGVVLILAMAVGSAFLLVLRSMPADANRVQESLLQRALFVQQVETDAPIQDRLEGFRAGWSDIRNSPLFGTGLGDSATYIRAQIFHIGWLWLAVSAGLPAALAMMLTVGVAFARTLRTLGTSSESPKVSASRLGFLGCLAALTGNAMFWGSTLDIGDVSDWGLLLGLLTVTLPRSRQPEASPTCASEKLPEVRP